MAGQGEKGGMLLARLGAETFADHADSSAAVESASEQEGLTDRARATG